MKVNIFILFLILLISLNQLSWSCNSDCQHGKVWPNQIVTFCFVHSKYTDESAQVEIQPFNNRLRGITPLQAKMLTRQAAENWSCLSQLKLVEVKDIHQAQIRIGLRDLEGEHAGFAYFPGGRALDGDIHMDHSNRTWTKELFYKVVLHEMGHSLGLLHNQNSQSMMYSNITEIAQPTELDIAHLQSLYGAPAPIIKKRGRKLSLEAAKFNNKPVAYYSASIKQMTSQKGQVVKVTIHSKHQLQNFTVSSSALTSGKADKNFFKASKGWLQLSANAKDMRNQSMRITSENFVATKSSVWNIERSYLFHGSESLSYLASIDGGKNFISLGEESGSSNRREYRKIAKKSRSIKSIKLSRFAGQDLMLVIEYKNKGLYWNSKDRGIKVSQIALSGILKQEQIEQETIAATSTKIASRHKKTKYIRVSANYGSTRSWSASKKK